MKSWKVAAAAIPLFFAACGPHRIIFEMPSQVDRPSYRVRETHSHGFGPLLIGGGGLFFLINEISPALIDYTGPIDTQVICPDGFKRVEYAHGFGQSVAAGALSWLVIFNVWHQSNVYWQCLRPPSHLSGGQGTDVATFGRSSAQMERKALR